ncbi:unnamed protein product [Pleuronectes platessa]|uniref:Uncharacterized protein n=1 Tax=Pleuronectes platessa TaxID=8262 RepID=A0A9N7TQM3_PLEPL|nr:unnamed protein product [Pleuronectes platessa]
MSDNSPLPACHMRAASERQQCGGKQKPLQPSIEALGTLNAAAHNGRFTPHCVSNCKFSAQLLRVALHDSAIENCGLSLPDRQGAFTTTTHWHGAATSGEENESLRAGVSSSTLHRAVDAHRIVSPPLTEN